ncbi:MAG: YIP1 family protein, partial [candidate division Zixibacteria bacterium]|nr:YIP1 family protein [candidate division Zixibacteria bacterium]
MDNENPILAPMVEISRPGILSRLWMVIARPSALFPTLTRKTDWIIPFIIVVLLGGAMGYFTRPIESRDTYPIVIKSIEKMKQQTGTEQYNKVKESIDQRFQEGLENKISPWYILIGLGGPLLISVIMAAFGLIVGNFIFAGKCNFWIVLNVIVYASLVGLLGDLVRGIIIILKDSMFVYTGLGLLKPDIEDLSFLANFLRAVDFF